MIVSRDSQRDRLCGAEKEPLPPRPDEGDIGLMVWPVVRLFLDSDFTLKTMAAAIDVKPRAIQRAILNPGASTPGIWGMMAHAMGRRIDFRLEPRK